MFNFYLLEGVKLNIFPLRQHVSQAGNKKGTMRTAGKGRHRERQAPGTDWQTPRFESGAGTKDRK